MPDLSFDMPLGLPRIIGNVNLGRPGLKLSKPSAATPPTFQGGLTAAPTPVDDSGVGDESTLGAPPAINNSTDTPKANPLTQPNYDWQKRATQADQNYMQTLDQAPVAAKGIRGKIGGFFNNLGWDFIGNPLQYPATTDANGVQHPSMGQYEANVARAATESDIANRAALRQQQANYQNITAQDVQDRIKENQLYHQQQAYDRLINSGRLVNPPEPGQAVPPSYSAPQGMDTSQPPSPSNLPLTQPNLVLPGYSSQQMTPQIGTPVNLKNPYTGEMETLYRPNAQTQQEMAQANWPEVTPEMADAFGLRAGDKIQPQVFSDYQRRLQAKKTQAAKPEKIDNVALAIKAAGGDPSKPETVTPEVARRAAAILKPQQGGVQLTPEAIQMAAQVYAKTGQLPSLGMGNSGAPARSAILNKAAEQVGPGGDVATNKATYRADSGSLASVQKMRDSVVAFERTAGKNLDLFTNRAQRVIDSGSPWINQPLRSVDQNGLGSADLAAYNAARQVALTEIAKVVNNPSLSSVLSDTARKEVLSLVPENATLKQIYEVANVLKSDMANRRTSLDQQIQEIKGRLGGTSTASRPDPLGIR